MADKMEFEPPGEEEIEVLVEGVDEIPEEVRNPPPPAPSEGVKMDVLLQGLQKLVVPEKTPEIPKEEKPKEPPKFDADGKYNETFLDDPKNHLNQWGKEFLIPAIASIMPDMSPVSKRIASQEENLRTTFELFGSEVEAEFTKIPEGKRRFDVNSYIKAAETVRNRHFADLVQHETQKRIEAETKEREVQKPAPYYETTQRPAPKKRQVILSTMEREEADRIGMPYDQYWRIKHGKK